MAVFVRYIQNNNYKEEVLTLLPLHDRTTGQILFECFQEFMNEIIIDKYNFVTCHKCDCYALLKNGNIVQIFNIVLNNSQDICCTDLICKQFAKYENYW
ncbi:hypothetical protein X777_07629 [Ooceraea biroi]|uniref:Uncharacterized protein n=1 Tax=Ooceraea biroi TaxID=2015173 RepID=A0A026X3G5_OOCBI|nr:hypothetical protein X777_07629 [Ooceraea biroi]